KLFIAMSVLVLVIISSCTTKKPTQFNEVTIFTGIVTDQGTGLRVENAIVILSWTKRENCTCVLQQINCSATVTDFAIVKPTNASGVYRMEIRWADLGFLFPAASPCQMAFTLEASTPAYSEADTVVFSLSQEDRTVPQEFNLELN
ncbi:MAG: hypothetical protein L0Y74_10880, partial [candidate division Zixibacteria bacterium]|nr:hypothetical protein [candidate division Zixibacteria bacterium]